jgi:DNA-binding CsgD family transcriptional regulator
VNGSGAEGERKATRKRILLRPLEFRLAVLVRSSPCRRYAEEVASTSVTIGGAWPLVGRDEELSIVAEVLARPGSRGIVLAGAAGMGKTRLAKEALAIAVRSGGTPVQVTGLKATSSFPMGAFAAFRMPDSSGDNTQLLREASAAVAQHAGIGRLVLLVDDAHLLDPLGAALVHNLVQTGTALLIATVRSGEPTPEPIVALWKDELTERLELQALSRTDVESLLEQVLAGYVDVATSQRLWRASGGNALFLRELVLAGVQDGALAPEAGTWRWRGRLAEGQRLVEVIEHRLGELDAAERRALELLAVAEVLSASALERMAPASVLATLEDKQLLTVVTEGRRTDVWLAHPLYGEVLRGRARLRARGLAARLADDLQASGARRGTDLLRLATWRLDSGDPVPPELSLAAGRRAMGLADHALAERLARSAIDAGAGFDGRLLLGQALTGQRHTSEADICLAELTGLASCDRERAEAALARAHNLVFGLNRAEEADRLLEAAEASVQDMLWRSELALARAHYLIYRSKVRSAADAVQSVLDRTDASDVHRLRALLTAATAWGLRGDLSRAIPAIDEGLRLADRLRDEVPLAGTMLRISHSLCLALAGRVVEADAMASEHYRLALERNDLASAGVMGTSSGFAAVFRGEVKRAARILSEVQRLLQEYDCWAMQPLATALRAMSTAAAGDHAAAEAALTELGHPTSLTAFATWREIARSWVVASHGERAVAQSLAIGAADVGASQDFPVGELFALHDAVRFGAVADVADRLGDLSRDVEGPLAAAFGKHACALLAQDGAALDDLAESFTDMGFLLYAAEAAAEASRCHNEGELRARAQSSAARAKALAARCDGARTPALADLVLGDSHRLTAREREIACLAAEGLSSREIGDRLFVSARTVDSHLSQVYAKLGVSRRGQLAALLGPA